VTVPPVPVAVPALEPRTTVRTRLLPEADAVPVAAVDVRASVTVPPDAVAVPVEAVTVTASVTVPLVVAVPTWR
jgi:hypothetical protein